MEKEVKHKAIDFLEYLGFKKVENGWKDKYDCFIYDNNIPEDLSALVAIQTGTAHKKGFQKALNKTDN